MPLLSVLKKAREEFLDRHPDAGAWQSRLFSATSYALWRACDAKMRESCRGRVLDAGSGRSAWRNRTLECASEYESIDMAPRAGEKPTWVGDITAMPQVPDDRYDTVICHQVLEHVPRPLAALGEFRRVLRPGGTLIISVPHLSRRHELPHDYYRYTQEGLASMLSADGFKDIVVRPYGGILSFLHHQVSFLFPGLFLGIPVLGVLALAVNAPFSYGLAMLDTLIDRAALIPVGVVATARKPMEGETGG